MANSVALPAWALGLLIALAAWALAANVVLPLVRGFAAGRANRVVREWNARSRIRIQPFKLTRRQALVDRLIFDAKVVEAAEAHAAEHALRPEAVLARVRTYADEIVPSFNAYFYFRVGYRLARWAARSLYRVRLGSADEAALAAVDPRSTVVLVMNHRSNMDYLLVSYMVAERTALSYAVGEWARIWPLEMLIRWMGAFFVRRGSGDDLYRRVLERYIAISTAEGVTQAVFPEGGLSRDGRLRPPKLGLLDYMVRSFDPHGERDLVFVPVGLNYDRTLEDRTLLLDLDPEKRRKRRPPLGTTLRFVGHNLGLMLRHQWHRFGYACVAFGRPVSLRGFCARADVDPRSLDRDARFALVGELAEELMARIGAVVPVLPVALVASVFVAGPERSLSRLELKSEVLDLWRRLEAAGAHVYVPRQDQDYAIDVGLRMLTLRHLVTERDGLLAAAPAELPLLAYYAGSIAHLLEAAARRAA